MNVENPKDETMIESPRLEALVATMDRDDASFLADMNLRFPALVVNQRDVDCPLRLVRESPSIRWLDSRARGLSRSRNLALSEAVGEIVVFADDDIVYEEDAAERIVSAHARFPSADIIAFQVERAGSNRPKKFRSRRRWQSYVGCLRISSVEITAKRHSILEAGIKFDEQFGSGATYSLGEEGILLFDCKRRGLKVLYIPENIGVTDTTTSSWFHGFDSKYFRSMGAAYARLSPRLRLILMIQLMVRKRAIRSEMPLRVALKLMWQGAQDYLRWRSTN